MPWVPPPEEGLSHTVFTDASDVGFGFIHDGAVNHTRAAVWTSTMQERTIAERELYAAKMGIADAVEWHALNNVKLRELHLVTDNTNCVSWLTKRRGKSFYVNAILKEVSDILGKISLIVTYIQSIDNPADRPSRVPWEYVSVWPPKQAEACSPIDSRLDIKATIGGPLCYTMNPFCERLIPNNEQR